ncbi:MAG: flippase-like domain-containing protein, partial [Saprospiraceae bacterium]|nr:flippase-like domain-containing protein [Saprospiraceae bacterium]
MGAFRTGGAPVRYVEPRPNAVSQEELIEKEFTEEQQDVLKSIRLNRVILPILLGVGVVIYLLWRQFDPEEFAKIDWTRHTLFWVLATVGLLIVRHLSYATRLRILSNREFSWRKCIELIFIWEFSSAVSPTSVGGSAVAFFVLAQEKLSTAKTATIVL